MSYVQIVVPARGVDLRRSNPIDGPSLRGQRLRSTADFGVLGLPKRPRGGNPLGDGELSLADDSPTFFGISDQRNSTARTGLQQTAQKSGLTRSGGICQDVRSPSAVGRSSSRYLVCDRVCAPGRCVGSLLRSDVCFQNGILGDRISV